MCTACVYMFACGDTDAVLRARGIQPFASGKGRHDEVVVTVCNLRSDVFLTRFCCCISFFLFLFFFFQSRGQFDQKNIKSTVADGEKGESTINIHNATIWKITMLFFFSLLNRIQHGLRNMTKSPRITRLYSFISISQRHFELNANVSTLTVTMLTCCRVMFRRCYCYHSHHFSSAFLHANSG